MKGKWKKFQWEIKIAESFGKKTKKLKKKWLEKVEL
jgi:hypothetical protein